MIRPWPVIATRKLGNYRVFTVRGDTKKSPVDGKDHEFFVIESVNWVNVIPLTANDEVVMTEQYRHGSGTVELELPGGMMDASDISPLEAGLRELREETGYVGEEGAVIGQIFPNPAIMSNICYTVLAKNCVCKHPTQFDHAEDIITRLVPLSEIPGLIQAGRIAHSLIVVAFYHLDLMRRTAR